MTQNDDTTLVFGEYAPYSTSPITISSGWANWEATKFSSFAEILRYMDWLEAFETMTRKFNEYRNRKIKK